jgi:orotate phosphoribosyltransferase
MKREQLADRLMETSYLEGRFTLRSGRQSHYIIDKYGFETRPEILQAVARELAAMLPEGVGTLAGVELGGVPLVTAVSLSSGLPFVIVKKARKGYGTDNMLEGELDPGDHVALIEDVTTTAGTACRAVETLRRAGAGKVTVLVVVDRQEGAEEAFRRAAVPYRALFTRESLGIRPDNE